METNQPGGVLGKVSVHKVCKYHPEQSMLEVPQILALLYPPPFPIIDSGDSPPTYTAQPGHMRVHVWFCPYCTYLELHHA